jgi:hypothetical protein
MYLEEIQSINLSVTHFLTILYDVCRGPGGARSCDILATSDGPKLLDLYLELAGQYFINIKAVIIPGNSAWSRLYLCGVHDILGIVLSMMEVRDSLLLCLLDTINCTSDHACYVPRSILIGFHCLCVLL